MWANQRLDPQQQQQRQHQHHQQQQQQQQQQQIVTDQRGQPCTSQRSFADRLQRIGAELDRELRQSVEVATQSLQSEARSLQQKLEQTRNESEWLQLQLDQEKQQSSVRLAMCEDLRKQLEELQQSHQQESEARDYWQRQCQRKEEEASELQTKLQTLQNSPSKSEAWLKGEESSTRGTATGSRDTLNGNRQVDEAKVAKCLEVLADRGGDAFEAQWIFQHPGLRTHRGVVVAAMTRALSDSCPEIAELCEWLLGGFDEEEIHELLLDLVGRREGALVHCIVRHWVKRLLNRKQGAACVSAVKSSSVEMLSALLALGADLIVEGKDDSLPSVEVCCKQGDVAVLTTILHHLRDTGEKAQRALQQAHKQAASRGQSEITMLLGRHLVVELSLLGNRRYRRAEFDAAIQCYEEAIKYCEDAKFWQSERGSQLSSSASQEQDQIRENLMKLRYNLSRALHRIDRWQEAQVAATEVIDLNPEYANAYVQRAQTLMAMFEWDKALEDWDRLVEVSPQQMILWQKKREECFQQLKRDNYEILEIPRGSDVETVKRAYRDLAKRWHPDKNTHRSRDHQNRAALYFTRIQAAYELLSDERRKAEYDAGLLIPEVESHSPPSPIDSDEEDGDSSTEPTMWPFAGSQQRPSPEMSPWMQNHMYYGHTVPSAWMAGVSSGSPRASHSHGYIDEEEVIHSRQQRTAGGAPQYHHNVQMPNGGQMPVGRAATRNDSVPGFCDLFDEFDFDLAAQEESMPRDHDWNPQMTYPWLAGAHRVGGLMEQGYQ